MLMQNSTPFPNFRFINSDSRGMEFGVALLKGTFAIRDRGLVVADEQATILFEDRYHGHFNDSSLFLPSDIVSVKPRTDIILNAVARAPGGKAAPEWTCGIAVLGGAHQFSRRLKVSGPRAWRPTWTLPNGLLSSLTEENRDRFFKGWSLERPEPVKEVPVLYEYAYGGKVAKPRHDYGLSPGPYESNPIGRGWVDREMTRHEAVPAPQIEEEGRPVLIATQHAAPAGFGPIPPHWLPRRPLGGTYDEHWRVNVWPKWPADYDFAYNNSANPRLVYPGLMTGAETIVLDGLFTDVETRRFCLPALKVAVELGGERVVEEAMRLDTLALDVAAEDPEEHRVFISWRTIYDHTSVRSLSFRARG